MQFENEMYHFPAYQLFIYLWKSKILITWKEHKILHRNGEDISWPLSKYLKKSRIFSKSPHFHMVLWSQVPQFQDFGTGKFIRIPGFRDWDYPRIHPYLKLPSAWMPLSVVCDSPNNHFIYSMKWVQLLTKERQCARGPIQNVHNTTIFSQ